MWKKKTMYFIEKKNNITTAEEIIGSTKKLKKNNCYIKSNFAKDINKYLKSFKNITP